MLWHLRCFNCGHKWKERVYFIDVSDEEYVMLNYRCPSCLSNEIYGVEKKDIENGNV